MSGALIRVLLALGALVAITVPADAQPRRPEPRPQPIGFHAFFDVGGTVLSASESFKAVTGSNSGLLVGGGGGVVLPQQIFLDVRVSRLAKDGHRVFVADGTVFDLGIENTIRITPIEVTAGYRFGRFTAIVPYAGGGLSVYRYTETDPFAGADAADERFTGYHLLGGVEYRVHRWFGLAGEAQWTSVPDAIGQTPGSVATAFGETDLGGASFRVKAVFGR